MLFFRRLFHITGLATGVTLVALLGSLQAAWAQSSNGAILVSVRACSGASKAEVVVKTASTTPTDVTKGASGAPISVPAGTYDLQITCTEMIDHPSHYLRGVEVTAGETAEREVSFPCGTTVLNVKRGGKLLSKNQLSFKTAGGKALPGTAYPGEPFKATPGQYEAEVLLGKGRAKSSHGITGIQVYDGAKRNIAVDI
jgi:hypothetical protein